VNQTRLTTAAAEILFVAMDDRAGRQLVDDSGG